MNKALKLSTSIIRKQPQNNPRLPNLFRVPTFTPAPPLTSTSPHVLPSPLKSRSNLPSSYSFLHSQPCSSPSILSPFSETSAPLFTRLNPLHLPSPFHRSFRSYAPSQFQSTQKTPKPHSSKPRKFLEATAIKPTPASSYTIFELFDKPISTARRPFVFWHGASGIPKHQNMLAPTVSNSEYHSHVVGEDSYFRRHDSLGVADGVGGWRHAAPVKHVVADSSIYSRKLMHYAHVELEKYDNTDVDNFCHYDDVDPVQILEKSCEQSLRDCALERVIGSSTAMITVLRGDELRIANLGDCGIAVIRDNDIIFRNEEQQKSFNYPFQLGTGSFDSPRDAQTFTVKIKRGDIVVMGSDGVFDNLFDNDVVEEVSRFTQTAKSGLQIEPQTISDALAWRAKSVSEDLNTESPFQSRASQEGFYYQGGKMDDITVLAAIITDHV